MIVSKEICQICGQKTEFVIEDGAVLLREAKCCKCGASIRNSDVAEEIAGYIKCEEKGISDQFQKLSNYKILNACSSGYIHDALKKIDSYTCGEYFEKIPSGEYYDGILCVDLTNIPFEDDEFDIVITEDVFEHIEKYETALNEIYRVLKPGGMHVFTVPVHEGRNTISRQGLKEIYHGDPINEEGCLVYTDWGDDIKQIVEKIGYQVEIKKKHIFYDESEIINVDETYDEYLKFKDNLNFYFKYNSLVIVAKKPLNNEYKKKASKLSGYTEQELRERIITDEKRIIEFNRTIRNKNEIIRALNDDNEQRGLHIIKLNEKIEEKEEIIAILQKENEERNKHISKLDVEISDNRRCIEKLQKENEERNKHIHCLDIVIEQKEQLIDTQKGLINNQIDQLIKQSERIEKQTEQLFIQSENAVKYSFENNLHLSELQNQIEKNKELENLLEKQEEKNKELENLLEKQEENIQKNRDMIQDSCREKEELKQVICNKEGHIELLLESERAYEREKNTHSYKFAKKIQKIGDFALPPNSRRRFFLRIVFNILKNPKLMIHVINPKRIRNYIKYMKLEGMEGVKKRYEEAVDIERMQIYPASKLNLNLEAIKNADSTEALKLEDFEQLSFTKFKTPTVSIIIPVYNEFNYTYNCLKSILKNSGDIEYEVIIANDCSTDITGDINKIIKNIKLVTTKNNVRFLLNCNNAAKHAKGKYILFLNNDTQVQENWLQPLIDLIESDDKIGMVGSKLVYPDGLLQEAGGILWNDGSAWNYGNRKNPEDSEYNYVKEVDYISGAAIMIRKDLWNKIGGFDENFAPAYCEDSDLAFEVRKRGYKLMYQPLSVVVHFEGVSNGTDIASGQKSYQIVNQKKFFDKWKDVLQSEHFNNAENVFWARDKSNKKQTILMIDHYVPHYDKDAGSRTVFQYLKMFVNKGYNVKFIGDNFYRHEPYTTTLQQMGIEVLYGPYYANNWKEWINNNSKYIKYVFMNRPHISEKYIEYVKDNTKAKIIYYGHDLHFLREQRKYQLTNDKKALSDSDEWKKKEISLMKLADVVYYPSNVEVEEISKLNMDIVAKAIVAYIFGDVEFEKYDFKDRKGIMFVGGFTHTPNVDAVLWFTKEVFPFIVRKIPDIRFYIMGSNPPLEVQNLKSDNVIVKGFVSDEELIQMYKKCRISIVPLRYGAGIKGKVIEAMRYGIPVVTTSVGSEGIEGAQDILCVEDESMRLSDKIVELYNNRNELSRMSEKSYKYICNNFSEEKAWDIIGKDFS